MEYRHGGDIYRASRKKVVAPEKIIDFSASVNPRALSEIATSAISDAIKVIGAYPDPDNTDLIETLADFHGLKKENILPGNGSTELIYLIAQTLKPKNALIVEPAFSEYRRALEINGCSVSSFNLSGRFAIDTEALLKKTLSNNFDLLYLANPANPTGVLTNKREICRLAQELEKSGTRLVIDEAFIDFAEEVSVKREVAGLRNSIVLRSMTKFYSMAGLRLGFIIAHEEFIQRVAAIQPPWSVNSLASVAAVEAITDAAFRKETLEWLRAEQAIVIEELNEIEGLKVYPSAANFLMIKIIAPGVTASSLQEKLLAEEGLLIRNLDNFEGLDRSYFRIAIRTRDENKLLTEALKSILKPVTV